jgi:hypothetical protein
MTDIPRNEDLARLVEAVETRLSAKINGLTGLTNQIDRLAEDVHNLCREVGRTRQIAIIGVGVVIASAFAGLGALWLTHPSLREAFQLNVTAFHNL